MTEENALQVSPQAADKVRELISEERDQQLRLRVYIVGGGCSGFQYGFEFDAKQNTDDLIFTQHDIAVIIDSLSFQYLQGATIHYEKKIEGERFVVINPNANTTCGCGSSFSV